jgi:GT2 family glycosyltransferase
MPTISVVLPFRDAERFLAEAVHSILAQEFTDFELLAVDDGSRDRSVAILKSLAKCDERVRVLDAGGKGLPAALNLGIRSAAGRYVARMDGDDVALPQRFLEQVAALERHPNLVVVGSAVEQIDDRGRLLETAWYPVKPDTIRAVLKSGRCCLCHPATMIRRDALLAAGGYRTSVPLTEDFDLWLRLARLGDLHNLDRPLLRYRLHPGSVAFHRTREQLTSLLRSAVLDRDDQHGIDQTVVERSTDLEVLSSLLRPDQHPAETFLDLASWYIENAVLAAKPRNVRRLAAQLATLAPGGRRRWVEQLLRETAALVMASRGRRLAALRFLLGGRNGGSNGFVLWRSVLHPPRIETASEHPKPQSQASGHLDSVNMFDGGRRVLLFGWLPVLNGALPKQVRVVAPCAASISSFRLTRRPDVAGMNGPDHLHAGFRIAVALERPLYPAQEKLRLWSRSSGNPWQLLHDESTAWN